MNEKDFGTICDDIKAAMVGRKVGKIFSLSPTSIAIDLFPHEGRYVYINYSSGRSATVYMIRRRLKDLERISTHPSPFLIDLRKRTFGLTLSAVRSITQKRVLQLELENSNASLRLYALLGTRPNLLLVDGQGLVIAAGRENDETGQRVGEKYVEPQDVPTSPEPEMESDSRSLSDILDERAEKKEIEDSFAVRAGQARKKLTSEIRKKEKLLQNLESDLEKHGDPNVWKRWGDLLLANIGNIRFENDKAIVTDYFEDSTPEAHVPIEPNRSPAEMAEVYFSKYAKARNAKSAVAERQLQITKQHEDLITRMIELERVIEARDEAALAAFLPSRAATQLPAKRKKSPATVRGVRRFVSGDGFDILVGKKAVDNDNLTFRIARSLDLWFHAEDYPGSHVIISNPGRKEIPAKTLIEAARLAAFYSDAREMPKVAVRYTPRKFVNKPKRAAPGLVSLASFKTILVEPDISSISPAE